jgi:hypothetical protein
LELFPGDYHVAAKGSVHPPSRTVLGCLCFLTSPL